MKPLLKQVAVPLLLLNARNDPFLGPRCFPEKAARENPHLHFEAPRSGGHVGFMTFNPQNEYWSETRAVAFLSEDRERCP